jgi:UDP-N-acetylglucosamine 2-epimerase (non-hydrolysing)
VALSPDVVRRKKNRLRYSVALGLTPNQARMIHIIIGTKAQLIKMAPVMLALRSTGVPYRFISTGQHRETIDEIISNFHLPGPDVRLYSGKDITSVLAMGMWSLRLLWQSVWNRGKVFGDSGNDGIVLVHGDTFSTLIGAIMGRLAGMKVGHVEAGLRSFNWMHPFPEEITRLLIFRLSNYLFCPGPWAIRNVTDYSAQKIDTSGNTLIDALRLALDSQADWEFPLPGNPFGVVSVHRFENIYSRRTLERVLVLIEHIAHRYPLVFILHKPTTEKLKRFDFYQRIATNSRIELRERTDYFRFIRLIAASDFVVSDGGSNQEECFYLGKPILLLRQATERPEGLGGNCILSKYDPVKVDQFLDEVDVNHAPQVAQMGSPSLVIADFFTAFFR